MPRISLDRAQAAKKVALKRFEPLGTLTGVGITRVEGEYAVKVNLSDAPDPSIEMPAEIDGVPLCVEITGEIKPRK
ncbi:MAG TPA: hypothetical protein VF147_01760 [Vicinamibacterales bacterium]